MPFRLGSYVTYATRPLEESRSSIYVMQSVTANGVDVHVATRSLDSVFHTERSKLQTSPLRRLTP